MTKREEDRQEASQKEKGGDRGEGRERESREREREGEKEKETDVVGSLGCLVKAEDENETDIDWGCSPSSVRVK